MTKYQKRISGPLLDRIDIHIEAPRVDYEKLSGNKVSETSESIRARVQAARIFSKPDSRMPTPVYRKPNHRISSPTPTCASGRFGSFANCRLKAGHCDRRECRKCQNLMRAANVFLPEQCQRVLNGQVFRDRNNRTGHSFANQHGAPAAERRTHV